MNKKTVIQVKPINYILKKGISSRAELHRLVDLFFDKKKTMGSQPNLNHNHNARQSIFLILPSARKKFSSLYTKKFFPPTGIRTHTKIFFFPHSMCQVRAIPVRLAAALAPIPRAFRLSCKPTYNVLCWVWSFCLSGSIFYSDTCCTTETATTPKSWIVLSLLGGKGVVPKYPYGFAPTNRVVICDYSSRRGILIVDISYNRV